MDKRAAYEALAKEHGAIAFKNEDGTFSVAFARAISSVEARALTADIKALEAQFTGEAEQAQAAEQARGLAQALVRAQVPVAAVVALLPPV